MKLAKTYCVSLLGLNGTIIEVEADISSNLPGFVLVGLPDASLSEATSRVRSATSNSGVPLPNRKVTVNLSPASVPKFGSGFDLAIAIAALTADGKILNAKISETVYLGELGLDGSVRPINGILPMVMAAKNSGFDRVVVPLQNLDEGKLVQGIEVIGIGHFTELLNLHGLQVPVRPVVTRTLSQDVAKPLTDEDLGDIHGQDSAVDSMVVAAVGGHHMLMVGSPGVGKTMLAKRLTTILPDLSIEQSLETTAVHSVAKSRGEVGTSLIARPPFEAPHHTASAASLVGGGKGLPTPGLISLAHNGVLFLDEAPEFQLPALESLRQALESGEVGIARSAGFAKFPARFQLVMAANPCPCGHALNVLKSCVCTNQARMRYLNKLSGPLLDRVDIRIQVRSINATQLEIARRQPQMINSEQARFQVTSARQLLAEKLQPLGYELVAHIPPNQLRKLFPMSKAVTNPLDSAVAKGRLSMRGYDRCLRIALSVAALDGRDSIVASDIDKAFFLRGSDNLMAAA